MEEKKQKRVLTIELDENVKKVSITGLGDDNQVVMAQELSEEELDQATGGGGNSRPDKCVSFYWQETPFMGYCNTKCIPFTSCIEYG